MRNIDNEVLMALKKKNGFIGLSLYPYHLKNLGNCRIEDFCEMIKQLTNIIGIDNIGIGSDLCLNWPDEVVMWMRNGNWTKKTDYGESKDKNPKWPKLPTWYKQPSDLKNFFTIMCENNISEKVATKIVGENWFNFMKTQF